MQPSGVMFQPDGDWCKMAQLKQTQLYAKATDLSHF